MSAISGNVSNVNQVTTDIGRQLSRSAELAQAASSNTLPTATTAATTTATETQSERDFIRVSSSIGRAATAGQLSRQEAVDIYRQIASLL
ncbi:MAG: hypothetical protein KKE30_12235 [Gammaproteobacteria bacterium]|nr:hypothetical protein [Gammaproteobacteria bacterium]MBU1554584.1 hypothetical protein [Gammaproteobacteria bacterium]MBU2068733.1 hypothetical protein [Gammaproteobacteria bacterium]MBU2185180.1 hypothetical protein [Gammaproteobacteria bacterium]MBU2203198.1 hypothetical protein [Gammaproteobacteria bacterium]